MAKKAAATSPYALDMPTMLSYKRSISQSRGLMWACDDIEGNGQTPLLVSLVGVRGTKSSDVRKKIEKDLEKKGKADTDAVSDGSLADLAKALTPNPQTVETVFMPEEKPFLKVSTTVTYLPFARAPHMTNDGPINQLFKDVAGGYAKKGGFLALGQEYVIPLVTGRWMWRNNDVALKKKMVITVTSSEEPQTFVFTPRYNAFTRDALSEADKLSALKLGEMIGLALGGSEGPLRLQVTAVYEMVGGEQAYPSQDIDLNKSDTDPSCVLYKVEHAGNRNHAAFHEQKIGNALRCIDNWHGHPDFGVQAVEPLGVVATHQDSTRIDSKRDFYTLCKIYLPAWRESLKGNLADVVQLNDLHYVMAVLVRGGVFV
jgi:CRISPR-associated protein Csy3